MKPIFKKIGNVLFKGYLTLVLTWIAFALSFDLFFIYLEFSGQEDKAQYYSDEIMVRIDGIYKNDPRSIWYEGDK